jgi:hypothetical protein
MLPLGASTTPRTTARWAHVLCCLGLVLAAGASMGASCGQKALSILPGVVNDPSNLSLRREILSYGTGQMCSEMQSRSVPLRLRDEDPVIGRFFPNACFLQTLGNENLFIQFGGVGYAWTNITKRMSFEASAAVEYDHDFLMDGDSMYIYFRQRSTSASAFKTTMVEQAAAASLLGLPSAPQSSQSYADTFGAQVMKSQVARGFTVIRHGDGAVEFGLGIIDKGQRPAAPYKVTDTGHLLLANERTEVHQNQREFVGPLQVGSGDALYLTVSLDGAPGADVLVVPRMVGDGWLKAYTTSPAPTAPPGRTALDEAVFAGVVWRRTLPLDEGQYYVVFDNTANAGRTQPTAYAGDDRAATISYAIELGDAP